MRMADNVDDSIDLERLSNELEKFDKMLKEGEDSDGGTCMDTSSSELSESPSFLDKYLMSVAKTGNPLLPWKQVYCFLHHKIDSILTNFYEKYGTDDVDCQNVPPFNYIPAKEKLLQHFDTFTGAPFTIQRLCEILLDPGRHYKRTEKLLRGLEKNILVVSTIGRISDDCSDPQQRSTLFNGLHMTTFRSFRPPLPDHADKFPDASDDVEMKDEDEAPGPQQQQQLNGDDPDLQEDDDEQNSFEDEYLKHTLEEELQEMEEDEPHVRGGDRYEMAINSVISIRRKRKEEHRQQAMHSKRIRMEQMRRHQRLPHTPNTHTDQPATDQETSPSKSPPPRDSTSPVHGNLSPTTSSDDARLADAVADDSEPGTSVSSTAKGSHDTEQQDTQPNSQHKHENSVQESSQKLEVTRLNSEEDTLRESQPEEEEEDNKMETSNQNEKVSSSTSPEKTTLPENSDTKNEDDTTSRTTTSPAKEDDNKTTEQTITKPDPVASSPAEASPTKQSAALQPVAAAAAAPRSASPAAASDSDKSTTGTPSCPDQVKNTSVKVAGACDSAVPVVAPPAVPVVASPAVPVVASPAVPVVTSPADPAPVVVATNSTTLSESSTAAEDVAKPAATVAEPAPQPEADKSLPKVEEADKEREQTSSTGSPEKAAAVAPDEKMDDSSAAAEVERETESTDSQENEEEL